MFPDSFFSVTYKSNYRKINLILKSFWDCFLFCVFCWYAVFTGLRKRKYEKILLCIFKKKKNKNKKHCPKKSRTMNHKEYSTKP